MYFIKATDFVGSFDLNLQAPVYYEEIFNRTEKECLREVLGDWLYSQVIADSLLNELTGRYEPKTTELKNLIYGQSYFNLSNRYTIYSGVLDYIKYMVFYAYKIEHQIHDSSIGTVLHKGETGETLSIASNKKQANEKYNEGLAFYYEIISYVNDRQQYLFTGTDGSNQWGYWKPPQKEMKNRILTNIVS